MLMDVIKKALDLCQPLGLLWIGLFVFWLWLRKQRQPKSARWCLVLWSFMTVTTCLPFGNRLLASKEHPWRDIPAQWYSLPQADVVVCLGGGVQPTRQEMIGLNMQENSDRPMTAVELLRRGRAPLLVIGGGAFPGQRAEAEAVKEWIEHWHLTTATVQSLGVCADTHDESVKVAALAKQHGWKRILLVTSAAHMNRASAVFRKSTGIEVVPVPCAFISTRWPENWVHLPDVGEYESCANWFHETIGWIVYRLRGWI